MAKLTVFENGAKLQELVLSKGQEYTIGRGSLCNIILTHPEISRQHIKISFDGTSWHCTVTSKFGKITVNGHPVSEFSLVDGVHFILPPFEFRFEDQGSEEFAFGEDHQDFSEKTNVNPIALTPVILRLGRKGQTKEEIPITEDVVIEAGRSKNCQIVLTDAKASRKHFSITYKNGVVTLRDLGSANKTYVNGNSVTEVVLNSGDDIRVGEDKFRMELVNPNFSTLPVSSVSEDTQPAVIKMTLETMPVAVAPTQATSTIKKPSKKKAQKTSPLFYAASGLLIIVLLFVVLQDDKSKKGDRNPAANPQASPSAGQMSAEQRRFLDETLQLADHLYRNQKPELALQKLAEIFRIVPEYKNARTLEALAQQLFEAQQQQWEEQRLAKQQADIRDQVQTILDECEQLIRARRFTEIEGCVGRIAELDPENARAQELMARANEAMDKAASIMEDRQEAARRKQQAKAIFESAKSDFSQGNLLAAKRKFASIGNIEFADTENLKPKAKQALAEATRRISEQADNLVRDGRTALETKEFKRALTAFDKAMALQPGNGDAKILKERALKDLNMTMKTLYQESIVEESTGAIERAKQKWKIILEQSPKSNEYAQKAKIKLGKYEK